MSNSFVVAGQSCRLAHRDTLSCDYQFVAIAVVVAVVGGG